MKLKIGDYQVVSDDFQFIVKEKKIVQDSRLTKKENIGNENWIVAGYFSTFESLFKFLCNKTALDNDDLKTIKEKIEIIKDEVKKISQELNIE